jgi:type IV pilus assembly protein PilC
VVKIVYAYVAYNENKDIVKGKLEAKNEDQAASLLSFAGYQVINLKESVTFPSIQKIYKYLYPVKPVDVVLFYRQMALLIESGLNIVTSIELLEEQASNRVFRQVLKEIITDIRNGSQFSVSLSKHPQIFTPIHCQTLKVGEQTGGLEVILRQVADFSEKQVNSKKGVKNAMTYPVTAAVVAVVVVAILITFVLPAFAGMYESFGAEMPAITRMMLDSGEMLRSYGVYILGALLFFTIFGLAYIKTTKGRYQWDRLSFKFPLVGHINHLNELARLCRTISVLFKAGLPLTEILPMSIQSCSNKVMTEILMSVRDDMLGGEGLARPMAKHPIFLPMMVQMVRVGEETGNMDSTLHSVAQSYEAEAEDRTKAMIGMIQPVMTIAIGLVVALVALSMVSAMYGMYSGMG